jgi:penicillin V acylase-like amidase (Ntn superfamily)
MEPSHSLPAGLTRINDRFFTATYRGDYGFDRYLARGGTRTEAETFDFLKEILSAPEGLRYRIDGMGCSTMQAAGKDGHLFGRNFDWNECPLLVLTSYPDEGYASISSINLDFVLKRSADLPADKLLIAAHYAPLDGMNEKGLCVAVNLLPDGMELRQSTGKPGLTITSALRLLLNRAATADEAVALLQDYDLGTDTGLTIHFLIADAAGKSLCIEYIHNVMSVIPTPVMTNHYLTPGPYFGQARNNSIERYDTLSAFLANTPTATPAQVRTAMVSVLHGTQWTAVYDQAARLADFYQKDDFDTPVCIRL